MNNESRDILRDALEKGYITSEQYTHQLCMMRFSSDDDEIMSESATKDYIEKCRVSNNTVTVNDTSDTDVIADVIDTNTDINTSTKSYKKKISTEYVDDVDVVGDIDFIPDEVEESRHRIILKIGSDVMHKDINYSLYCVLQALKTWNDDPNVYYHTLYLDNFKMEDIADLVASPKGGSITRKNVYEQIKLMYEADLLIYDKENRVLEIPKIKEGELVRPFYDDTIFKLTSNIKSDNLRVWMYLRNQKTWFDAKGQQTKLSFTTIYNACFGQVGTLTDKVKDKLSSIKDDKERASETKKAINKKCKSDLKKISNIFKELQDEGYLKYATIKQNKDGWSSINSIGSVVVPEVDRRVKDAINDAPNVTPLNAM